MKRLPDETVARIVELKAEGLTSRAIGSRVGMTPNAVIGVLWRLKNPGSTKWSRKLIRPACMGRART